MARNRRSNSHPTAEPGSAPNRRPGLRGEQVAVPLALLIGALLFGIACSKRGGQPAAAANPATAVQNPGPAAVAALPPTPAPEKKKAAKHHPVNATYADAKYGVSFRYPRKYRMETGESTDAGATPMNFIQPGGVVIASVELPRGSYPGTDFASGTFQVAANRALSSAQCEQFLQTDTDEHTGESLAAAEVKIGGRTFQEVDLPGGPAEFADRKYYHVFENGMCYELAQAMTRKDLADGMPPVDQARVFGKLDKILATVRLQSLPEQPQVAAGETTPSQPETSRPQETNNQ